MKRISKNLKVCIILVVVLIFIGVVVKVIIDGYKGESPDHVITMEDDISLREEGIPNEQRLLTEQDIEEFEERSDVAGGFYLYDGKDNLVGRDDSLELDDGYLECSIEFMNISKDKIQFTLLLFVDGELQSFSVDGEREKYFYNNKQLANRETDKIKIKLKPNLKDGVEEHKILFYSMFMPVDCYDGEQTILVEATAEHVLTGVESASFNAESTSYDYTDQITFIDGPKLLDGAWYSIGVSSKANEDMAFNKKITTDEQNMIYYKFLKDRGNYKAVVLRDGEIIPAFDNNSIIEWEQKEELSVIPVDTKIQDLEQHTFLLIVYSEDSGNLEVYYSHVVIVSSH